MMGVVNLLHPECVVCLNVSVSVTQTGYTQANILAQIIKICILEEGKKCDLAAQYLFFDIKVL